jgi:hypothetical protein
MRIIVADIIEKIDDNSFADIRDFSKETIVFSYLPEDVINKAIYIEKVNDYFETFCVKNGNDETTLPGVFTTCLLSELSIKPGKKTREELYYNKLKTLAKEIKKEEKADLDKLLDFTRTFVSLYSLQMKKKGDFDFCLSNKLLTETMKGLKSSKSYKALLTKCKKTTDVNVKYSKIVFSMLLLELFYLHMLINEPQSEVGGDYGYATDNNVH